MSKEKKPGTIHRIVHRLLDQRQAFSVKEALWILDHADSEKLCYDCQRRLQKIAYHEEIGRELQKQAEEISQLPFEPEKM